MDRALAPLIAAIAAHTPATGENTTLIAGLSLYRRRARTPCYSAIYEPSLNIFAQGHKRINLGGVDHEGAAGRFLISSVDVPVQSQVLQASADKPLLSLLLALDLRLLREVLAADGLPDPVAGGEKLGLAMGDAPAGLIDAATRLVRLLDTPADIAFLAPLLQREILFRLLQTPQAARLRAIASASDTSHRTARAIAWLRQNYTQPLRIESLAEIARMGVSTLHHQFRSLTAMSPLQYQKQLRLQAARESLLGGMDATSAAYGVGYESVSQFNREYARLFGQPPMRDIRMMRGDTDGLVA